MRTTRAFTLIELLIVIAIIAILAAILFPVFATAREKARQTACASNMKQLALGILQYVQDYDELYPYSDNPGASNFNNWSYKIYPYVKSVAAFTCPDDNTSPVYNDTAPSGNIISGAKPVPISYATNINVGFYRKPGGQPRSVGPADMLAPAATVLLFETSGAVGDPTQPFDGKSSLLSTGYGSASWDGYTTMRGGGYQFSTFGGVQSGQTAIEATGNLGGRSLAFKNANGQYLIVSPTRHDPGSNFAAADGHVKFLQPQSVSSGGTNTNGAGYAQDSNCPLGVTNCAASVTNLGSFTMTMSPL